MNEKELLQMLNTLIQQRQAAHRSGSVERNLLSGRSLRFDSRELERFGLRLDANETAVLDRALNQVLVKVLRTDYGVLKGRNFVPRSNEVVAGKMTYSWREFTGVGTAKLIANPGDDFPMVETYSSENFGQIKMYGNGFAYSIFDLQRAAAGGERLDTRKALEAREAYERLVDTILAIGDKEGGLLGLVNQRNPTVLQAPATGTGSSRLWSAKTPALIVADMEYMVTQQITETLENETPNTLLLSTARFRYAETTQMGDSSGDTILTRFLKNSRYIKTVESWSRLDTADAAGTGPRAVAYNRNPLKVSFEEPVPYTMLPPQQRNFAYRVPCYGALGGVQLYKPKSVIYMDSF